MNFFFPSKPKARALVVWPSGWPCREATCHHPLQMILFRRIKQGSSR